MEIDEKTFIEIEKHSNDLDFIKKQISNKLLKKIGERTSGGDKLGVYILFGTFLEGLHILLNSNVTEVKAKQILNQTALDQHNTLVNILQIIKNSKLQEMSEIQIELQEIDRVLTKSQSQKKIVKAITDKNKKTTIIKTKSQESEIDLSELKTQIEVIRNKYIN